jgi:ABC-type glycerol-3-phosphate transport system permease component
VKIHWLRQSLAVTLAGVALMPMAVLLKGSLAGGGAGYGELLVSRRFWMSLANSGLLASAQTLGGLLLASLAGYSLARRRSWMARLVGVAALGLAALPPQLLLPGGF